MAVNSYGVVRVKIVLSNNNVNIIGDTSVQAICELFDGNMQIYGVDESVKNTIKEDDLAVVDQGMEAIQNTDQAFPKNKIIKIIRGNTKTEVENLIKNSMSKLPKPSGLSG